MDACDPPLAFACALLLALAAAAGCGREDAAAPAPRTDLSPDPTPETAPVAAYRAWLHALATQDAEAACARHAPGTRPS